ncbi:outer membrane protein assembly factor BamA, partial [Thermodesulfobacteriota bacterium]
LQTRPGEFYSPKTLDSDIRAVFKMGYFDDIQVDTSDVPGGKVVTYRVKEKPTLRSLSIRGNRIIKTEELQNLMDLSRGSILNLFRIQENVQRIAALYKEKNYHNVDVRYEITERKQDQADLDIIIDEGEKALITQIRFEGSSVYPEKKLKRLMKTSEKGFLSWLTSSGDLNQEDLDQDIMRLASFYHNNGYIQAKVADPEVAFVGNDIHVTIKIVEGQQFGVGQVDIEGDLIHPREELLKRIKISKEKVFNRQVVRKDILALGDVYSDAGYAYAEIHPRTEEDLDQEVVNITYVVEKGDLVTFEKIIISGNTKTRDKVIRREFQVSEQGLYSGSGLKEGVKNLQRLDYFGDIKINTPKGSQDDTMVLRVDVTEKPTGAFTFGGGYSSTENAFFMTSIAQRNLFGRGQTLNLKAQLGSESTLFNLGFLEPWLFDIPLSLGLDVYNWQKDYDTYRKESSGGRITFGYPVWKHTRAYVSYLLEQADVTDVGVYAPNAIRQMTGATITSSTTGSLVYDSRDRFFNPTSGSRHRVTVQYAGSPLGGDVAYTKYTGETGWFIPLLWGTVGHVHAEGGYVQENSGGFLPIYDRFYIGGINSLRGFDWRELSPTDQDGAHIGGDKFVQFNVEYIIPLLKQIGMMGVAFFDTGDVYDNGEDVDLSNLRESAGFGVRWYSPLGPIRLERAYILDPQPGEDSKGRWEFSMGAAF